MDIIVKLNNQTAGRDKIARLIQYGSRATWHCMQVSQTNIKSIDTLKSLEYTLSTFRKLLRLGRFLDSLYACLATMKYPDLLVRITVTLSKIANVIFLFCDHLLWAARAGVANVNTEKWNRTANKYWLYSIVMNLVRDFYEINRILELNNRKGSSYPLTRRSIPLLTLAAQNKDVVIDTVKNGCDMFIPLTALGYTRLSPGMVGLLGVISSVAGIIALVDPMAKLTPA